MYVYLLGEGIVEGEGAKCGGCGGGLMWVRVRTPAAPCGS